MRILITGICGFVGSSVALRIREGWPNADVAGIDNFIRPGSEINRNRLCAAGVRVVFGDVRSASDFEPLGQCDWVIDAAAIPNVTAGVDGRTTSRQLAEHNLLGTINLLEHARHFGAGVVLLSTSRVYSVRALAGLPVQVRDEAFELDAAKPLPAGCSAEGIAEGFSTAAPVSLYGATKLASELLALEYGQAFGFPVIVNRCGVLAGGGQFGVARQGIFSYWPRAYALRQELRYIGFGGRGHQVRDALHPDDLSDLLLRQMDEPERSGGRIWNVGGGRTHAMSLAQLSRWCAREFGPHHVEGDPDGHALDAPWIVMDARHVRSAFDWTPGRTLPAILSEIAAHHRSHPAWLAMSQAL